MNAGGATNPIFLHARPEPHQFCGRLNASMEAELFSQEQLRRRGVAAPTPPTQPSAAVYMFVFGFLHLGPFAGRPFTFWWAQILLRGRQHAADSTICKSAPCGAGSPLVGVGSFLLLASSAQRFAGRPDVYRRRRGGGSVTCNSGGRVRRIFAGRVDMVGLAPQRPLSAGHFFRTARSGGTSCRKQTISPRQPGRRREIVLLAGKCGWPRAASEMGSLLSQWLANDRGRASRKESLRKHLPPPDRRRVTSFKGIRAATSL